MKQLFLLVGIIIVSVKAGTLTEEYVDDIMHAASYTQVPRGKTHYKAIFNNLYTIETRTLNSTLMEFQITAKTTGWVGIILNPNKAALSGGDVLIAGIHDYSNQPYFTDMYGDANGQLKIDSKPNSDWILVSGDQSAGSGIPHQTKFVFHRQYKTNDTNIGQDYSITKGELYFVAIMGQDDNQIPASVSEHHVGSCKVNFVRDGTDGEIGGANGLTGSFHLILTTVLIIACKLF